jgi:hypothetical protein
METPRPVTAGPAEFPRSSQARLSLPSFLYGNPRFRVTPSFFRLCSPFIRPPTRQHRRKAATPRNRRDASPLPPPLDPNNNVSARFRSVDSFVAPPLPPLSPTGVALEPKAFHSLTCQELSSSFVVQLAPLRASPASASLLRELFDSGHSKQTVPNFCVRYSVRSFLAPAKQPQNRHNMLYMCFSLHPPTLF